MDDRTCRRCALKADCLPAGAKVRTILIVDGNEALLLARRRRVRWDEETIECYKRHRWRVAGVHGEAKNKTRIASRRSPPSHIVSIQVFMTAAAINIKRLAVFLFSFSFYHLSFAQRIATFHFPGSFIFRRLNLSRCFYILLMLGRHPEHGLIQQPHCFWY